MRYVLCYCKSLLIWNFAGRLLRLVFSVGNVNKLKKSDERNCIRGIVKPFNSLWFLHTGDIKLHTHSAELLLITNWNYWQIFWTFIFFATKIVNNVCIYGGCAYWILYMIISYIYNFLKFIFVHYSCRVI